MTVITDDPSLPIVDLSSPETLFSPEEWADIQAGCRQLREQRERSWKRLHSPQGFHHRRQI